MKNLSLSSSKRFTKRNKDYTSKPIRCNKRQSLYDITTDKENTGYSQPKRAKSLDHSLIFNLQKKI